jgi:hypothetical protein
VSRITTEVTTGSACAPIAAMVATSPATPPAPLASLALKDITQAGAGGSCTGSLPVSTEGLSAVMEERPKLRRTERDPGLLEVRRRLTGKCEVCCVGA